jgi:hypothetical protein
MVRPEYAIVPSMNTSVRSHMLCLLISPPSCNPQLRGFLCCSLKVHLIGLLGDGCSQQNVSLILPKFSWLYSLSAHYQNGYRIVRNPERHKQVCPEGLHRFCSYSDCRSPHPERKSSYLFYGSSDEKNIYMT